jgi:hypothetical protein
LLETTDANGELKLDVTDDFGYVDSVVVGGSLAGTGYVVEVQKPAPGTALTASNLLLGFYQSAGSAAALAALATIDLSSTITGLTVTVRGKANF